MRKIKIVIPVIEDGILIYDSAAFVVVIGDV